MPLTVSRVITPPDCLDPLTCSTANLDVVFNKHRNSIKSLQEVGYLALSADSCTFAGATTSWTVPPSPDVLPLVGLTRTSKAPYNPLPPFSPVPGSGREIEQTFIFEVMPGYEYFNLVTEFMFKQDGAYPNGWLGYNVQFHVFDPAAGVPVYTLIYEGTTQGTGVDPGAETSLPLHQVLRRSQLFTISGVVGTSPQYFGLRVKHVVTRQSGATGTVAFMQWNAAPNWCGVKSVKIRGYKQCP